jgi:tripartite-type tricarboxylate transporter receptor subunit TctC
VAWQGIAGPAGLPPAVVKRLNEAFLKSHEAPGMKEKLANVGLTSVGGTPEEFGRYIKSEIAKWSKVAKDIGATVD